MQFEAISRPLLSNVLPARHPVYHCKLRLSPPTANRTSISYSHINGGSRRTGSSADRVLCRNRMKAGGEVATGDETEGGKSTREKIANESIWNQIADIVRSSGQAMVLWICGPFMSLVGQGTSTELASLGSATSNPGATSLARQIRGLVSYDELVAMFKVKMALMSIGKQIHRDLHWRFCYSILNKVSTSFAFIIQHLPNNLRDSICVFYLLLRALDTIEDDTSIPAQVKVPLLIDFHKLIYDRDWHFSCGSGDYKLLMDQFHHVSTAFLEFETNYQEVIVDSIKKEGAGMAKFIHKEVESIDDYDEYCFIAAGYVGLGLSKLFHASGLEDLASDQLSSSAGVFLQKVNIIQDYLEDINEIPQSRRFWPREIWSKYVNKLEDLKYEENSEKAVQCLNDMVTDALIHVKDCITCLSTLKDPMIFRSCAIPLIIEIGTLTLCYNNSQVFKGEVNMRRGLVAKVLDRANTMADFYGATFDFSCMLEAKNDPSATKTISRIEEIKKICRDSGTLDKRKLYIIGNES